MRQFLAILVGAGALVAAGGGTSAPTGVDARMCAQRSSFFNVQILGDRDAFRWTTSQGSRVFASIPDGEAFVAVWSLGGPVTTSGVAIYGSVSETEARLSSLCSEARSPAKRTTGGALRAAVRVKDGWNFEHRYGCLQRGRFRIDVRDLRIGRRVTVRMERTGELIAVAEVGRKGGWLRASKRCDER